MGFSQREYWSGLPCPPPGSLPNPGIKPSSPALQADSLSLSHQEILNGLAQFSSVTQSHPSLCDLMDCIMPGFPVLHHLPEHTRTHVHQVSDAIQPSHLLSSPSPAFILSQNQGLFQGVSSLHQVAKVLELQLQHQSFQWLFRTDLL